MLAMLISRCVRKMHQEKRANGKPDQCESFVLSVQPQHFPINQHKIGDGKGDNKRCELLSFVMFYVTHRVHTFRCHRKNINLVGFARRRFGQDVLRHESHISLQPQSWRFCQWSDNEIALKCTKHTPTNDEFRHIKWIDENSVVSWCSK